MLENEMSAVVGRARASSSLLGTGGEFPVGVAGRQTFHA